MNYPNDFINKVILGDCLDILPLIPDKSIDLILCDMPFGTTKCKWDVVLPFNKLWEQYKRIITSNGAILLFGTEPFSSKLRLSNIAAYKYDWVWDKVTARGHLVAKYKPMQQTETISVFGYNKINYYPQMIPRPKNKFKTAKECKRTDIMGGRGGTEYKIYDTWYPKNLLTFSAANSSNTKLHPTQKPVELLEYLIKTYTKENDIVLDNCAGSGSALVAAKNINRQWIGIEKEEKYYNICLERLNTLL